MQITQSHRPYIQFVETTALGELGLVAFVGLVCLLYGTNSLHDIGTGLLVAGFGASLLGVSAVMSSIHNVEPPGKRFTLPPGVRSIDPELTAAMNVSPQTYHFFWIAVAIGAGAFFLGALLVGLG